MLKYSTSQLLELYNFTIPSCILVIMHRGSATDLFIPCTEKPFQPSGHLHALSDLCRIIRALPLLDHIGLKTPAGCNSPGRNKKPGLDFSALHLPKAFTTSPNIKLIYSMSNHLQILSLPSSTAPTFLPSTSLQC